MKTDFSARVVPPQPKPEHVDMGVELGSESWKGVKERDRESLNCLDETINRNLGFENTARESSKGTEGHTTGNWKKEEPHYAAAESLATLWSAVR